MTKHYVILRNAWYNFEAIRLLVILVTSLSSIISTYCWSVVFISMARAMPLPTCLSDICGCVFESGVSHLQTSMKYIFNLKTTNLMIGLPVVLFLNKPIVPLFRSSGKPK